MSKRTEIRDIIIGEEYTDKMNNKKTSWTRIGTAFVRYEDDGTVGSIGMKFKCYPAHGEDPVAFPPKPKEERAQRNYSEQPAPKEEIPTINVEDDEEVPVGGVPF